MCIEIAVKHGDKTTCCETVGELAAALEVPHESVSADPTDCCLCNVYLENLGARQATDAEGFPFPQYIIERPHNS